MTVCHAFGSCVPEEDVSFPRARVTDGRSHLTYVEELRLALARAVSSFKHRDVAPASHPFFLKPTLVSISFYLSSSPLLHVFCPFAVAAVFQKGTHHVALAGLELTT